MGSDLARLQERIQGDIMKTSRQQTSYGMGSNFSFKNCFHRRISKCPEVPRTNRKRKRHNPELNGHGRLCLKAAVEANRELHKVYGDAALSETTCRDWFHRFKDCDFDVDDRLCEGTPKISEDSELEALLDEDPCQTIQELSLALGVTRQAISKRLHALGMIQ
ncbi:hypothetical protein Trydic_g1887 [Trypoxylus dichotomus]